MGHDRAYLLQLCREDFQPVFSFELLSQHLLFHPEDLRQRGARPIVDNRETIILRYNRVPSHAIFIFTVLARDLILNYKGDYGKY